MPGAPDETAREEDGEEEHAVVPLKFGTGEVEFIQEPVDVEEWGGEFVENEGWGVEVYEGSLLVFSVSFFSRFFLDLIMDWWSWGDACMVVPWGKGEGFFVIRFGWVEGRHTNPKLNTHKALIA